MLFNSTIFLQFFAAFLLLFFLCRNSLAARNYLVLGASCLFYAWWDYRFLALLMVTGCVDFAVGLGMVSSRTKRRRRGFLCLSLVVDLSILGFFKYFNFFVDSFAALLAPLHLNLATLEILLPVGISFYTFQSLSYVVDVYRGQAEPTRSLVQYLAYISFFPQLVAGPIERCRDLLPQFQRTLVVTGTGMREGLWLILWGLFKKVVVADNLAPMVELVFDHPSPGGPAVLLGAVAFALQIYGDFSGYSDVARGLARVLGFNLSVNFRLPYFATDIREFWQRWHVTLSSWLRDYLYISLGGNRRGELRTYVNLLLTMLLGGLWHGAAWNFVLWGGWHGIGLMVHRWWRGYGSERFRLPGWLAWFLTMAFVLCGWLLFRARSWDHIQLLFCSLGSWTVLPWAAEFVMRLLVFFLPLGLIEWWQRRTGDDFVVLTATGWLRCGVQSLLLLSLVLFWQKKSVPFIYFQF